MGAFLAIPARLMKGEGLKGLSKGFTLLEVLVSVALLSVLSAGLYTALSSVLGARGVVEERLERLTGVSRFLDTFSREAASAYFNENNRQTFFKGEKSEKGGVTLSTLSMTAFTYPPSTGRPTGDLVAVRYSVAESGGRLNLLKEVWNPYASGREEAFRAEAIEGIDGLEITYFNGKDWSKLWDAALEKGLPAAVRASIEVKVGGERKVFRATARPMIR